MVVLFRTGVAVGRGVGGEGHCPVGEPTTIGKTVPTGAGSEVVEFVFFLGAGFFFSVTSTSDGLLDLDFFGAGVQVEREDAGDDRFFSVIVAVVAAAVPVACLVNSLVMDVLTFLSIDE